MLPPLSRRGCAMVSPSVTPKRRQAAEQAGESKGRRKGKKKKEGCFFFAHRSSEQAQLQTAAAPEVINQRRRRLDSAAPLQLINCLK